MARLCHEMLKYFEPSKLERWRGGSVFTLLGVRFFKQYLLPTELFIHLLRADKHALQAGNGGLAAELKRLERETRRNEVIHPAALVIIGGLLALSSIQSPRSQPSFGQLVLIVAINLYVNVYPILVQRYNRLRIIKLHALVERRSVRVPSAFPSEA